MENEIMNYEDIEIMDGEIAEEGGSGIGTGVAMLIGAGIAFAVGAGVKLVKKGVAAYKAKKELRKPNHEVPVDDAKVVEIATK